MEVAGAIALAEALKVAVVTCGQEFHEDARSCGVHQLSTSN